jgi:hypothetical protein
VISHITWRRSLPQRSRFTRPLLLQPVEQPGDARRLLDHALGDLERRQALGPGPAQDAEHVELLERDPVRLHDSRHQSMQQIRRAHHSNRRLLVRGGERPLLLELGLEPAAGALHGQ